MARIANARLCRPGLGQEQGPAPTTCCSRRCWKNVASVSNRRLGERLGHGSCEQLEFARNALPVPRARLHRRISSALFAIRVMTPSEVPGSEQC